MEINNYRNFYHFLEVGDARTKTYKRIEKEFKTLTLKFGNNLSNIYVKQFCDRKDFNNYL